jgi:hypothetical protein
MCAFGRARAFVIFLWLTPTGLVAWADEPEHIHIDFSAPQSCSDEGAFVRSLRRRTGRFVLANAHEQARQFVVTITATGSTAAGRLEVRGPGSALSTRSISGRDCREVVSALALMAALAIDPSSLLATPSATSLSEEGAPSEGQKPVQPTVDDASRERSTAPAPQPSQAVVAAGSHWAWSTGAHVDMMLGIAPVLGLGGRIFAELAGRGASPWNPSFRAGLAFSQSDTALASGAGARFRWALATLEGCPARLGGRASRLGFQPCLALHFGRLRAEGRNLDAPEAASNLWADVGPVGRLRVAVSQRVSVEAQAMLVFPLRRLTFDVEDAGPGQAPSAVFTVPHVGTIAGIGVSYEFR